MKICCTITSYLPAIGGAQLHTHAILKTLAATHNVSVVTQWDQNRTDWLLGTTIQAPAYPKSYVFEGIGIDLVTYTRFERARMVPQVFLYHVAKRWASSGIADVLMDKIVPLASGCDLVHNSRIGRESLSVASLGLARKLNVPFILVPYHHPRWVGWNYRTYIDLYRKADGIIAMSEWEKVTLSRLGVSSDRIFVTGTGPILSNTSDGARFRGYFGMGQCPMVLFLGQQFQYKGIDLLLQAAEAIWAREPTTVLVFIGPPTPYSERLFAAVSDRRILNLGKVDLQMKTDALAACDVLCVPSSQESFGGIYTEAWALGKPVIGGSAPAVREVIQEGVDGYIVDSDPGQVAERVNYLLARPALREKMGEAGCQKVRTSYTWERLAARTEEVYRSVITNR